MIKSFIIVFIYTSGTYSTVVAEKLPSLPIQDANCVLPPYPENGGYTVSNYPSAKPGERYPSVKLIVSCDTGYLNKNTTNSIFCVDGDWSASMPTCSRFCTLVNNVSVEYRCVQSESLSAIRECEALVPAGTTVTPICRSPNYFSRGVLPKMHCVDGIWDYNPNCLPECGMVSRFLQLRDVGLTLGRNNHNGLPWHAIIYSKVFNPYMQICAGSLITTNKIISAAHCFWNDKRKLLPVDNYAVTVGNLYRPYNEPIDSNSQKSNVVDIKIPTVFQGATTNYQDDIAIVVIETPFIYSLSVRPVCLSFDNTLDKIQLADGNKGTASGWNIGGKDRQSHELKIVELPYINMEDCFKISPTSFRQYLTNDKFCVGSINGTSLCLGDGGGGIAFLDSTTQRYYLRGVLSVAPRKENDFSSPSFTSVVTETDSCPSDEHKCLDGSCISLSSLCDGRSDCLDGSDEQMCLGVNPVSGFILNRNKRQAQNCRVSQWQCRDGTCIGLDGKCDGVVDCPDFSDETFALCRKTQCQSNWFRCTYGACVDLNAPCNGVQDCADNSDELLPSCRNQTANTRGKYKCANGEVISTEFVCDGKPDCADGSDEVLGACAGNSCASYLFQCAYGACVAGGSDCNGKQECADGSDESDELCNRISTGQPVSPVIPIRPPLQGGNCVLPPYPKYGTYTVNNNPAATPGKRYPNVKLQISCNPGFQVENNTNSIFCENGDWSSIMPKCVQFCRLPKHPSVEYRCVLSGPNSLTGSRECDYLEPSGTVATPICRSPNYYTSEELKYMHCVDGIWDYIAKCNPECGTITPEGIQLVIGGKSAKRGELPWHAGIYSKLYTPYMQICGGSLISTTTIISAAHCFWSDANQLLPAVDFAVGVGKLYRPYNEPHDKDAQLSDVADIKIPSRFRGSASNFQDDIALVEVGTPFTYEVFIRPVCLSFDIIFDKTQLSEGNMGKVAGWGLTDKNGKASQVLKVVNLPYVKVEDCYAISPPTFRAYITSDKFCAGYTNGTTLCQGDSGGGLAFSAINLSTERYYLRGIVSTAPRNDDLCNAHTFTTFTSISRHEHFIKQNLK